MNMPGVIKGALNPQAIKQEAPLLRRQAERQAMIEKKAWARQDAAFSLIYPTTDCLCALMSVGL